MWTRNTVRESSHISFFCGGDPLRELERQPENTHGEADKFPWLTNGSLPQSKITDLILSLNSHAEIWTCLFAHVFSVYGWLSELTYFRFFSGNLLILSENGNMSLYPQAINYNPLYFSLSCETTLLMLSCDRIESAKFIHGTTSPAKSVYYMISPIFEKKKNAMNLNFHD